MTWTARRGRVLRALGLLGMPLPSDLRVPYCGEVWEVGPMAYPARGVLP